MALILAGALVRESSSPEPIAAERTPDARAVYRWLATVNAQAPVRAAYANPRVLTLESRVPAMAHVFAVPSKHLQALQDLRITHLVLPIETPRECRARLAHELPGLYPEHFSLEYENLQYRVYRLVNLDTPIQPIDGYLPVWGGARCNPTLPDVR